MPEYKVSFRLMTAKAGKRDGEIIGGSFDGECGITTDVPMQEMMQDEALKAVCYQSVSLFPDVKKAGAVVNITILNIEPFATA